MGTPRLQIHATRNRRSQAVFHSRANVGDQTGTWVVTTWLGPPASGSLGDTRIHLKYS